MDYHLPQNIMDYHLPQNIMDYHLVCFLSGSVIQCLICVDYWKRDWPSKLIICFVQDRSQSNNWAQA